MVSTLYLIFNHTFTPAQEADARASLGVGKIETMPAAVGAVWGDVPADAPSVFHHLAPVRDWLRNSARPGDHVLIQGDFGACYLMARFAFDNGFHPIYATTRREATEETQPDGSVRLTHRFRHVRFRWYGK
jgi:hypothetical protein